MYYLCCCVCAKYYPTKIDIYYDGGVPCVSMIVTFNEDRNDRYLAVRMRLYRKPPNYDLWTSTDFEKYYNTYVGAKRGLLYWLHQFDHDSYKYDNKQFQKILTIMNEERKEIPLEYIYKKAYHAYRNWDDNSTCETIHI